MSRRTMHSRAARRLLAKGIDPSLRGRELRLAARAHIEVQQMIDERRGDLPHPAASRSFIEGTHQRRRGATTKHFLRRG
jgi:hypothetical protein